MKRYVAMILVALMLLLAIPAHAQAPPPGWVPNPTLERGVWAWACLPKPDGSGTTCQWTFNYGEWVHNHGDDGDHDHEDDHEEENPLRPPAKVSGSCQFRAGTITCALSITPTVGGLMPLRYRVQLLDVSDGRSSRTVVAIKHTPPRQLNPTMSFTGDASTLLVKVQAVGDCKREEKHDAGAERCARHKTRNTKIKLQVAR